MARLFKTDLHFRRQAIYLESSGSPALDKRRLVRFWQYLTEHLLDGPCGDMYSLDEDKPLEYFDAKEVKIMPKFRKKPVVIEAVQITDEWFDGTHPNPLHPPGLIIFNRTRKVEIKTFEGTMTAEVGDWIITGIKGEKYPCKPDIFEATYDEVVG